MTSPKPLEELQLRQIYNDTLIELAEANPAVCLLEADLMLATGTHAFQRRFPERCFNVGVAEANMVSIGAGLSTTGKIPFCTTFTPFLARRAHDQITISVAYANRNVKLVGTEPGITATINGGTHMCFQDLGIMRVMPNMIVLSPTDAYELRAMLHFMAAHQGPVYMQLIRRVQPRVFGPDYVFELGKLKRLADGTAATIVSTGMTTTHAQQAVAQLRREGVSVDHFHAPCVKPLDSVDLIASARKTGLVITVESQNILGGLGSAVCEILSEHCPTRVRRLGVPDQFGEVASEEYLMRKHGFDAEAIVAAVRAGR